MGLLDDDFKISMDDIKDMVSEIFGEKVEKVDSGKAKEILRESTEEFMNRGIKEVSAEKLTAEEENILREFESAHAVKHPVQQPGTAIDAPAEENTWLMLENKMREKVNKEAEKARSIKGEEIKEPETFKIESTRETAEKAAAVPREITANYSEKMNLSNMFEQSQAVLAGLLDKLMRKKAVETMLFKTLEKCIERYPDVLKKTNSNQSGRIRQDGTLDIARLAANLNAMYLAEEEKTGKFLEALHGIFKERLAAIDLALGSATKDEVLSNLLVQTGRIFGKKGYSQRLKDIFNERIAPDNTLRNDR